MLKILNYVKVCNFIEEIQEINSYFFYIFEADVLRVVARCGLEKHTVFIYRVELNREDGDSTHLRNVGTHMSDCTVS